MSVSHPRPVQPARGAPAQPDESESAITAMKQAVEIAIRHNDIRLEAVCTGVGASTSEVHGWLVSRCVTPRARSLPPARRSLVPLTRMSTPGCRMPPSGRVRPPPVMPTTQLREGGGDGGGQYSPHGTMHLLYCRGAVHVMSTCCPPNVTLARSTSIPCILFRTHLILVSPLVAGRRRFWTQRWRCGSNPALPLLPLNPNPGRRWRCGSNPALPLLPLTPWDTKVALLLKPNTAALAT